MIRLAAALCSAAFLLMLSILVAPGWFPFAANTDSMALAQSSTAPAAPSAKPTPPPPVLPPEVSQVLRSGVLIVISKSSQRMYVFKDGTPWGTSPVSTGRRGHATPAGVFPILQKQTFHRSNIYSNAPMPFMQRLTWSGIAIHAGHLPGYPASHGCVRLPRAFAQSLFTLTRASSTTVVITNAAVRSDSQARTLALNTPMPRPVQPGSPPEQDAPALAAATQSPKIEALPLSPALPAGPGQTIQLAAAATPDEADAYWRRMLAVHPELAGFQKSVIPAVVGSRQVYRLRVTAPGAHAVCSALKSDGYACFNVR
jgi:hypothetical protein